MQLESIILCALAAVVGAAPLDDMEQGRRGSEPAPAAWSDYAIVPMTWDVKVRPDEESIQLEGTAQEVYRRLVELNPNYDVDFANATSADDAGEGELQRRTDFRNSNIICSDRSPPYAPFGRMDARSYYEANNYLGRLKGSPTLDAGPRVCGRVSCSYDGAVYVCNDTPAPKTLVGWSSVRDGLVAIYDRCLMIYPYWMIGGQVFHSTNWNVIYRSDSC